MQNTPPDNRLQNPENSRLRLPFEDRRVDFVTWTYIHRAGIYMIVIVFLLFGIAFVSCKIHMGERQPAVSSVQVDLRAGNVSEEIERLERIEQLMEQSGRSDDYSGVANRQSNENARLNSSIHDAQSEAYRQADKLSAQMAANRAEYEAGLRSEQNILNSGRGSGSAGGGSGSRNGNRSDRNAGAGPDTKGQDSKVVGGRVTVSFSFKDPVRTSERLVVPAYLCEGGGEVVVNVTLNKNGDVISASVDRSLSSSDECMRSTAEKAARNSRFNVDNSAPAKHSGTITYIFIPQ